MNQPKWIIRRVPVGLVILHEDGRLIATIHEEAYAPQIAAAPELFESLDNLTDVTTCPDGTPRWFQDLAEATRPALLALAKAKNVQPGSMGRIGPWERTK